MPVNVLNVPLGPGSEAGATTNWEAIFELSRTAVCARRDDKYLDIVGQTRVALCYPCLSLQLNLG